MNARKLILPVVALLILAHALTAYAAETVEWECVPAPDTAVAVGESIAYKLTLLEDMEGWTTLTIRLGEGMSLDSFKFYGADTEEEADASQREIIPGNDGCVILASRLNAGDMAVFTAHFDTEDALPLASAYTDEFSSSVEHRVLRMNTLAPEAEALPSMTDIPDEQEIEKKGHGALIAIACIIMTLAAFAFAFWRKPWMERIISSIQSVWRRLKFKK